MLKDPKKTIEHIRFHLDEYIKCYDLKSLVIGVSGGIDSALCCALVKPVCKDIGIPLIGRSIPIETNKEDEIIRADRVGKYFCTEFEEDDLSLAFQWFVEFSNPHIYSESDETKMKLRLGNIKARLRMIYLYDLAQKNNGMVLSTDNYTEYLLGFWTLHGDVGDYGMLQNLWKTEVYQLAQEIIDSELVGGNEMGALFDCIHGIPTDGLDERSDYEKIGAKSYDEIDQILQDYLNGTLDMGKVGFDNPVIQRYKKTNFKRYNPLNLKREDIV